MKRMNDVAKSLARWTVVAGMGVAFVLATADVASAQIDVRQIQKIQQQQRRLLQQSRGGGYNRGTRGQGGRTAVRQIQRAQKAIQRAQQQQQKRTVEALKKQGIETPQQLRAVQEQAHYNSLSPIEKRRYDGAKRRLERLAKQKAARAARLQRIANGTASQKPPAAP